MHSCGLKQFPFCKDDGVRGAIREDGKGEISLGVVIHLRWIRGNPGPEGLEMGIDINPGGRP